MAVLDPVVGPAADLLFRRITKSGHRSAVGLEPIRRNHLGRAVALQRLLHEGQCRCFITGFGDEAFEDLAFVIDGAPQVVHLAVDLHVLSPVSIQ